MLPLRRAIVDLRVIGTADLSATHSSAAILGTGGVGGSSECQGAGEP